jgi:hypothetical protein
MDEAGWSGYHQGLSGTRVIVPSEYREEAYRVMAQNREHISLSPPFYLLADHFARAHPAIPSCQSLQPMFTFPRKYLNTKLSMSHLDPSNTNTTSRHTLLRGSMNVKKRPRDVPDLQPFDHLVSSSTSGNVNSTIILNAFKTQWIPELRAAGITKEYRVRLPWDKHASHENEELLQLFEEENIHPFFFVSHSSQVTQPHDLEHFPAMKPISRKLIDKWSVFYARMSRKSKLGIEDFPFIVQPAYTEIFGSEIHHREAAKKAGLVPFDPDVVLKQLGEKTFLDWKKVLSQQQEPSTVKVPPAVRAALASSSPQSPQSAQSAQSPQSPQSAQSHSRVRSKRSAEAYFYQTASQPDHNRSPQGPDNRKRFLQHPHRIVVKRADVFDFAASEKRAQDEQLVREGYLDKEVLARARGTRVGQVGSVFTSNQVRDARVAVAEKKQSKEAVSKAKKRRARDKRAASRQEVATLKTNLRSLKVEVRKLKVERKHLQQSLGLSSTFTPKQNRPDVFCYCKNKHKKTKHSQEMIFCQAGETACSGRGWYHVQCVGLTPAQAKKLDIWRCQPCAMLHEIQEIIAVRSPEEEMESDQAEEEHTHEHDQQSEKDEEDDQESAQEDEEQDSDPEEGEEQGSDQEEEESD